MSGTWVVELHIHVYVCTKVRFYENKANDQNNRYPDANPITGSTNNELEFEAVA